MGADRVLEWTPPEVIQRYYPGGIVGNDKEGHPVWIEPGGRVDMKGKDDDDDNEDIYCHRHITSVRCTINYHIPLT